MNRLLKSEPEAQARDVAERASAWSGLNLGCGHRFHPAWVNLDLQPAHPSIRQGDVTQPLPFADTEFDAVYHSHLLEHLPRLNALSFLQECRRVLKPGGMLRLAIPNLEAIARLYLHALDDAWAGDAEAVAQHRWLVLEMYDRATREQSGGALAEHLQGEPCELARYRFGADGTMLQTHVSSLTLPARLSWRERFIRWLLGKEYALLQLGRFRRAGEVHHWMYDRVSLRELLTQAGFVHFRCVGPATSAITNWSDYHLDMAADGAVIKPDSLFVEAERP